MLNVTQIENNVNSSFTLKKEEKKYFWRPPSSTSVCELPALFLNIAGWSHLGGQTGWFDSSLLSGILSISKT